ncbi:ZP domain-containing protein [Aphelenchoides bicaudatus]|nr:ZP domain-containing protein [Aphelenchoides bicaudatus]
MHSLFYLLVLTKIYTFTSIPIDNGVEGKPIINCGSNEIEVSFKTRSAFQGRLYVKGQSNDNDCQSKQIGRKFTGINVLFDACSVQRLRSLNPRGIFALTTLVLTFHPTFLTKIDRTYRIVCFYTETEKKLDEKLEVADLTTAFITQQVSMPVCRYEILNGHPNGEPVHFGVVGQQVYHKFSCDSETIDTFCMLINSCFVEAQDRRVEILDTRGCAIDKFVLNDLEYVSDLQAGQARFYDRELFDRRANGQNFNITI